MIPINSVHENPKNPRFISKDKFKKLCNSIKAFPQMMELRPMIVDKDNMLIGGNMRWKACQELGMAEIPETWVKQAGKLTAKQIERFIIADNLPFGEWDDDVLANNFGLEDLKEFGFEDKDLLGFDTAAPVDAAPQIDRAAELNKVWKVKTGDIFSIGSHKLLCGDSTHKDDAEKLMGNQKATCVFTDPPYGVSIGKKNVMLNTFQKAGMCLTDLDMDDMPPAELGDMLLKVFKLWRGYMADDCSVFVCSPQGGGLGMMMMMMMMMNAGLEVKHILNWIKNGPTFSMGRLDYDYQHEPILFTWVKTHKRKKEGAFQTSLWTVDKPMANKEHPTMKPVELPTCAILNHTDAGDIIADMFGGSGTTMIAAENTKRVCRMTEISPAYCAVILERMKTAFPDLKITKMS
jgi:hypothetical protein